MATWREIAGRFASSLLIVNSDPRDGRPVADAVGSLRGILPVDAISVVCPHESMETVLTCGVRPDQLLAARVGGQALEINYFLGTHEAYSWFRERRPSVILGTAPHSLFNEEVKDVFERAVCPLLGDNAFIAHALPSEYLYLFDAAEIGRRMGRARRMSAYRDRTSALMADLHHEWVSRGEPALEDEADRSTEMRIVHRHLGYARFDEDGPGPATEDDGFPDFADAYRELAERLHERIGALEAGATPEDVVAAAHGERNDALARMGELATEVEALRARLQAVSEDLGRRDEDVSRLGEMLAEREEAFAKLRGRRSFALISRIIRSEDALAAFVGRWRER